MPSGMQARWPNRAGRLMAVQAIKGVEIGMGFEAARRPGSQVHDPIHFDPQLKHSLAWGTPAHPITQVGWKAA